jgi:3-hydroxybenzoate 6-monooxygenase
MNKSSTALQILVAGGGIGGLALAYVLAQDGHRVTVLEQSAAFGEIGAGIQLGPNIFKMFDYLGLTDAVSAVSFFPSGLRMNDVRSAEQVVRVPLAEAVRAAYGFPYGVIYRVDLHRILLEACGAQSNVTLRTSAKVEAYTQSAEGVRVTLAGGETLEGSALVGADGLWSRIREAVVGDGKPRVSGHIA